MVLIVVQKGLRFEACFNKQKCYLHQIKLLIWSVNHDVLLITSVGGPLVAWVVLGIQVTEGRLINVDPTPIGLDRILFELETNLFTI